MELIQSFQKYWQQHFVHILPNNAHLLLAVSGGLDSVVLVDLVTKSGFNCSIVHCNFTLRDLESDRDEQFVTALGNRVPTSIKIFLAALAIVDDLGAIVVIALFYSSKLDNTYLVYAGGILAFLATLNYFGVKRLIFYLIPGVFLWYLVHHSGIHATIAGVLLACFIPTNPVKETSPLEKLEHLLLKPVNLFIMPLFALANTNIQVEWSMLKGISSPIGLGIILGLVFGKPIGVFLFSWISVKLGWSRLPSKTTWKHIVGLGMLAGIGFTMSTFIALLSFKNPDFQLEAKFCILIASILAACIGYSYLSFLHKKAN